jgi:ABC-type multidrug transport system fused ATPase/permease subunit
MQTLKPNSFRLLYKAQSFLPRSRKIQVLGLFILMLLSGFAELVSLSAVVPLLAAFTEPTQILTYKPFRYFCNYSSNCSSNNIVLYLTIAFCLVVILTAVVRLLNLWFNCKMSGLIGHDLSSEAYKRVLHQPYIFHINSNSSELINTITNHVSAVVYAINATFIALTSAIVSISLFIAILYINWQVAVCVTASLGIVYVILSSLTKARLQLNSHLISFNSQLRIKLLQEGLGSIRDVILDSAQSFFVDTYRDADYTQRLSVSRNDFIVSFPRYTVEAIGICFIAAIGGLLSLRHSGSLSLPILGTIALGAQRLLPSLQQIYNGISTLRGANSSIVELLAVLSLELPKQNSMELAPLELRESIRVIDLGYQYKNSNVPVLSGINLTFNKGDRIAIIGKTGSGKSTFCDILMGLIDPTEGKIFVDNIELSNLTNPTIMNSWRKAISHVPQHIFMADSSIAMNIAIGTSATKIDQERLEEACDKAQILDFINDKSAKFNTIVGERGVQLSGGQKQRIGIARALYKNTQVLFLDEATSALDSYTENKLIRSIDHIDRTITVFIIAHRLNTLNGCNRIIKFDGGSAIEIDSLPYSEEAYLMN